MPKVSKRGEGMPSSPIRKLTPYAVQAEAKGVKIYRLNIGQPDICTPSEGLDALCNIDRKILDYTPSEGYLSLRKKFAEYYSRLGIDVTTDEIVITSGGSEALHFIFSSCMNAGDEILTTDPMYANYISLAYAAGVTVRAIKTSIEDGFALPDADTIEAMLNERTKAILICNPNNPTGSIYSRSELERIRDIVKKYDLFLISDEVYREFCYTDEPLVSAMSLQGIEQNTILVDSVSKRYSECGIRIGNIVTRNKEVLAAVMKFAQARLCPPLLGQLVAEASMDAPPEYIEDIHKEYIERRNLLIEGLNAIEGVYAPMPQGAFYTMARLPIDDCDEFCKWLLSDFEWEGQTVMMAPGNGFYIDQSLGKNEVRIGYVLNKDDLRSALRVLEKGLERYPGRVIE